MPVKPSSRNIRHTEQRHGLGRLRKKCLSLGKLNMDFSERFIEEDIWKEIKFVGKKGHYPSNKT